MARTLPDMTPEVANKIAVLKNKNTPEKTPDSFFKKLSGQERDHMRRTLAKYGNVMSPRNRELLRNIMIVIKDGVPYWDNSKHMTYGPFVVVPDDKLTEEEIAFEL